ncbi:plasmid mobilization relaxosome protein MobC [Maribacter sp.]|uniref:plasmid mobilization relaxosome protein MobC n=1 Tax=Maribacter sp. TaxID=1897614 RepID=UPI0025B895E4|nr:plasmid mobilization relaxosome protein MobC [Maribacter sp.]|tara:strand:+ start:787 stop:1167 length:381 start_codon:yes stop_codon:yes gene_type:complete
MADKKEEKRNKGGAPKKAESDKIAKGISIYFNAKELELFDDFIQKNNLVERKKSALIKQVLMKTIQNDEVILKKNTDPKLFLELNKIGTNINQIAKKFNSLDKISNADHLKYDELLRQLGSILNKA